MPQGERRARLEAALDGRPAARPPDAGDEGPGDGGRLVRSLRRRRSRRRHREAARRRRTSRASGRCSRSSTSARPTASSPGSAGTRTGRARTSGRCCWACTTTRASSTTSASRPRSRGTAAPRSSRSSRRSARTRSRATRGRNGPSGPAPATPRRPVSGCPGATSRWNRGKDLSWEPLRAERVVEVAYDHLQGSRFRHATTFKRWRPGQAAGGLPLRPARDDRPVRARVDLRRAERGRGVRLRRRVRDLRRLDRQA